MVEKRIKLDLELATKGAQAELKAAAKEAKKLGEEIDDTRSAGKKFADAMNKVADNVESDFQQAKRAADKLEQALGEDAVIAAKNAGMSVDNMVAELKRAGLTYDDIEQDVDELAAAMKRLNQVGDQIDTHITKNMQGVKTETEKTGSVVANFAGNAAQEIPGISGAFGPLNMAIGQFAEYAAEGDIALGKMVTAGLGLAAVAGIMSLMSMEGEKLAKVKAFKKGEVEAYTEALGDSKNALEAVRKKLQETQKIGMVFGDTDPTWGLGGISIVVEDLIPLLNSLGLSVDQTAQLIAGGETVIQAWGAALIEGGANAGLVQVAMDGLTQQSDALTKSQENAAIGAQFFGKATKEAGDETRTTADAVRTLNDRFGTLLDTLSDEDAFDNTLDGFDDIDQAAKDAYEAAASGAEDAASKARDYEAAIRDQKRQVIDFADELGNVPKEVVSDVIAMLDRGEFDKAKAEVQRWADTPTYKKVIVATKQGQVGYEKNAVGTSHNKGGVTLVGETGPELVQMPKGSRVTSANQTANLLNRNKPTSYVDNRTFNIVIPNQTPEATAREVERYNRRNGLS